MSRQEMMYASGLRNDVKLNSLILHKSSVGYYLHAKYTVEDEHSIREIDIPKIHLRVDPHYVTIKYEDDRAFADIGFGYVPLIPTGRDCHYFTETILEEKTKEMTLEEIEKKLGHKVKIISKPESRDDQDWTIMP